VSKIVDRIQNSAIPATIGAQDISIVTSELTTTPMFTHIVHTTPRKAADNESQTTPIKVPSLIPLPQGLYLHGNHQITNTNPLTAATKPNSEHRYALSAIQSPTAWYHIEAGGTLIQVNEDSDTGTETMITSTPVQDELPSPTPLPVLSPYNQQNTQTLQPTSATIKETKLEITKVDTGSDPIQTIIVQDRGTSPETLIMHDMACSPRRATTTDTGTNPIIWWLEDTRNYLKQ
jgi:hypothetical protein